MPDGLFICFCRELRSLQTARDLRLALNADAPVAAGSPHVWARPLSVWCSTLLEIVEAEENSPAEAGRSTLARDNICRFHTAEFLIFPISVISVHQW